MSQPASLKQSSMLYQYIVITMATLHGRELCFLVSTWLPGIERVQAEGHPPVVDCGSILKQPPAMIAAIFICMSPAVSMGVSIDMCFCVYVYKISRDSCRYTYRHVHIHIYIESTFVSTAIAVISYIYICVCILYIYRYMHLYDLYVSVSMFMSISMGC